LLVRYQITWKRFRIALAVELSITASGKVEISVMLVEDRNRTFGLLMDGNKGKCIAYLVATEWTSASSRSLLKMRREAR